LKPSNWTGVRVSALLPPDNKLNLPLPAFPGDSAYIYVSPWSKLSTTPVKFQSGGDCGLKFSHVRRSWDFFVTSQYGPQAVAARIPASATFSIAVGSSYLKAGNPYVDIHIHASSGQKPEYTFTVRLPSSNSWTFANSCYSKVVSIAQEKDLDGMNGSFFLNAKWLSSNCWQGSVQKNWSVQPAVQQPYPSTDVIQLPFSKTTVVKFTASVDSGTESIDTRN
jgi:hypothetical protein